MLAINLGLGDVTSALRLLEYSNHPEGTTLSDERVRNGSADPHDVRLWCLGNELDGPWQLGHRSAEDYAHVAAVAASAMRMFDEDLELVAVGSSNADMPTFGAWEETVLERTIGLVDYLSCHIYFFDDGDLPSFLRSAAVLDRFLEDVDAVIRRVRVRRPDARDVKISLDEWNVWNFRAHDAPQARARVPRGAAASRAGVHGGGCRRRRFAAAEHPRALRRRRHRRHRPARERDRPDPGRT